MKKVQFIASLFVLAVMSTACFGDAIAPETLVTSSNGNDGGVAGFTFTANLTTTTSNTFSLDLTVVNTSGTVGSLSDFTLSLLGGGNSSNLTLNAPDSSISGIGWTQAADGKLSGGNGNSTPTCSTAPNGYGGWVCAYGPALAITSAGYDFHFTGTYQGTVTAPFDLIAGGSIGGTKLAVSDYMTVKSVPEPASMLLFGSGLSGVALLRRLKKSR